MHEFGYKRCLLDCIPCLLVEGEIVVECEREVEQDIVLAGEETLQFLNDPDS